MNKIEFLHINKTWKSHDNRLIVMTMLSENNGHHEFIDSPKRVRIDFLEYYRLRNNILVYYQLSHVILSQLLSELLFA